MRYVIETPCEHGKMKAHEWGWPSSGHSCSGGSRRVVTPTTPDYEAAWSFVVDWRMEFHLTANELKYLVDAALTGLVVIEGTE